MAHQFGSARSSYGNTSPGDQNSGKEVSTQNYYTHDLGWVMLRPKSSSMAEDIAACMVAACNNNNIGYDQSTRNTLFNAAKPFNFDVSKVSKKVNTDCSALVRVCCNFAGIPVGDFTTSNLVSVLTKTGFFEKHTNEKYTRSGDYLKRGDILCTKTKGHVVVVIRDGSKVEKTTTSGKTIVITGGSVNVRKNAGKSFDVVRIVRKDMRLTFTSTKTVDGTTWYQIADGWVSGKYAKEV